MHALVYPQKYGRPERRLAEFGRQPAQYGQVHECSIEEQLYQVLPLAHPRQVDALGTHSIAWRRLHRSWMEQRAGEIQRRYLE